MNTPSVSVLLPVYNAEQFLSDAILSILEQTYGDFELLVIDDGSTDRSAEILRSYAAKDSRLKLLSRENRGLCATLNELIELAKGKYVARMDADDICEPDRFQRQVEFLDGHPEVVVVGGAIKQIDAAGRPIRTLIPPLEHDDIDAKNVVGHTSICHPTAMIVTAKLRAVGAYDVAFEGAEDLDLWLRLAEVGKLTNLREPVLLYRLHEKSVSATRAEEQAQRLKGACEAAWARRGLIGPTFEYTHWRPNSSQKSQRDYSLKYAWQAWRAGNRSTAIHYASRAVRMDPLALAAWKALAVVLIRRAPSNSG